ncbi:MAG TPA: NAD(P)H-binding protein [Terriglobia bacterium]|nr:NAD(P)H-binding protein [Terriglobia bacterium]
MTYLVTGTTGTVGSLVVEGLLARNANVRAFVRDGRKALSRFGARVEVFTGDLADAASLRPGLVGADAVFLLNSGPDLAARDEAAAKAAWESGAVHVVKLSSYDACEGVGTGKWHARGEAAIRASGVPFTFVQPSGFMSNALFWARSVQAEGVVRACTGDGAIPFIHPRDVADVATEALTSVKFRGESLAITGPDALSYAEMALKIAAAIGKTIRFESISEDEVRRRMMESGDGPAVIDAHLSIYRAIRDQRLARVTDTVERVLGRKPLTFDQWVEENVSAFAEPLRGIPIA